MTPIREKLQLKGQSDIVVLNAPDDIQRQLYTLQGVTVHHDASRLERMDFALLFVKTDADIAAAVSILSKAQGDPVVWFAYPNIRSKRYKCEFDRDSGWAPIRAVGFKGIRQIALDEDWSILRFRRIEHIERVFNPVQLTEARIQRGWSQGDLAKRAGVVQNYISRLEKDRIQHPNMYHLQKIADALEMPLTTFLLQHQNAVDSDPDTAEVSQDPIMVRAYRSSTVRVFICHASSDKPAARELYQRLKADGFEPWLDEEDLLPGQNWRKAIPKAVADSHVVVVCLSKASVTKQGFVQKEIGYALDVATEQPEDTIFIIPIRLEECSVPDRLDDWQWVNLYEPRGYERLLRALYYRAESLRTSDSEL